MMRSSPNQMPATRQSWPNIQPMPPNRSQLSVQRAFTEQEFERICYGLIPEQMEDKWFIFFEADTLYFHRSWTGYCIYQLRLRQEEANHTVVDALVNREPGQYSGADDSYDERLLMFLIDSFLLGGRSPLPMPAHVPAGMVTELHHHHVIGAGPRGAEVSERKTQKGWLWRWLTRGLSK